ncbi:MAG: helix-turn-helix domain-containing protein [Alphaproteobacteria bacterium]|nr:helix-turn-helix domain-containing protein [Alphaproteobacteria bacterium]
MEIGEKIRKLRTERQLTQAELAEKIFVSVDLVSKWENGRRIPDSEQISEIAELFGVETDDIFDNEKAILCELSECVDPEIIMSGEMLKETVEQFIKSLDSNDAQIFVWKYYFLRKNTDIADEFSISENHLRMKLSRIRKKLKKYIEEKAK